MQNFTLQPRVAGLTKEYLAIRPWDFINRIMATIAASEDIPQLNSLPVDDFMPTFYVGHHESRRPLPIVDSVLRQAQDVGVSQIPFQIQIPLTYKV